MNRKKINESLIKVFYIVIRLPVLPHWKEGDNFYIKLESAVVEIYTREKFIIRKWRKIISLMGRGEIVGSLDKRQESSGVSGRDLQKIRDESAQKLTSDITSSAAACWSFYARIFLRETSLTLAGVFALRRPGRER